MSIILDLAFVAIVIFCGYRGFRSGIINGICGILAIIIAIYGAFLIASTYSSEFEGLLSPFAGGIVDGAITDVSTYDPDTAENEDEVPRVPLTSEEKNNVYSLTFSVLRELRFPESIAAELAEDVAAETSAVDQFISQNINSAVCDRITYAAAFAIIFSLIAIIFSAIGNIFDLKFGLPGFENINHIIGAVLGAAKGVLIIIVLGCIFRYVGMFIPDGIIDNTRLLKWLTEFEKLSQMINL